MRGARAAVGAVYERLGGYKQALSIRQRCPQNDVDAEALTSIEFGRDERLYAIAFWLFYSESGTIVRPPVVGLGEETTWQEGGSEGRDAGFGSGRWNPADLEVRHPHTALPLTDDFVAVVRDPSQGDGEEWRRRGVDEPLFSALFPNLS